MTHVQVAPLHKKVATDQQLNNSRPIFSLASVPCKILLDHIVLHHLNTTLDAILYNNKQHGFRRGRDYLCATYYHEIVRYADQDHQCTMTRVNRASKHV